MAAPGSSLLVSNTSPGDHLRRRNLPLQTTEMEGTQRFIPVGKWVVTPVMSRVNRVLKSG